jgi:hypothetical protein
MDFAMSDPTMVLRRANYHALQASVGEAALDHYVISERPLTEDELALQSAVMNLEA